MKATLVTQFRDIPYFFSQINRFILTRMLYLGHFQSFLGKKYFQSPFEFSKNGSAWRKFSMTWKGNRNSGILWNSIPESVIFIHSFFWTLKPLQTLIFLLKIVVRILWDPDMLRFWFLYGLFRFCLFYVWTSLKPGGCIKCLLKLL